jgi:hypothetical protein
MDGPAAASRRGIHYPCLHNEWDSPLGPCTVTTGVRARNLVVNLGGEEEAQRCTGRRKPMLFKGG